MIENINLCSTEPSTLLSTLVCSNVVVVVITILMMTTTTATKYIQYVNIIEHESYLPKDCNWSNKYSLLTIETWLQYQQSHPQGSFIKFMTM